MSLKRYLTRQSRKAKAKTITYEMLESEVRELRESNMKLWNALDAVTALVEDKEKAADVVSRALNPNVVDVVKVLCQG